jgi:hypothetical protein
VVEVNGDQLNKALNEFEQLVNDLYGVYLDATSGFRLFRDRLEQGQKAAMKFFPGKTLAEMDDNIFNIGEGNPNEPGSEILHRTTTGAFKQRNDIGGANFTFIANMLLVAIYQYWDDYYRDQIATALAKCKDDVKSDIMGDIRLFRNSIVHHRAIAKPEIEKCKLLKWFKPGQSISLDKAQVKQIIIEIVKDIAAFRKNT